MTPYEQIVAIIDAAGPPPDPAALEALSEQAANSEPKKRKAKNGKLATSDSVPESLARSQEGDGGSPPEAAAWGYDVDALNREYALVLLGNKAVIFHDRPKAMIEDQKRILSIGEGFGVWFKPYKTQIVGDNGRIKTVTWSERWLSDRKRRQYFGIEFHPDPNNAPGTDGYLNVWSGFAVAPARERDERRYKTFRDHILQNICSGNVEYFNWVFGFFAHIVQKPRERLGTALVMRGKMGTGKTKVGEIIGRLFPRHYFLVDDPRYVTGQFNAHMATCLVLQADEAVWAGDKAAEGRLKGLITSPIQQIEAKGIDPIRLPNYVRLIMTSNEEWVVPAGKDERRFCVLDVHPRCAQLHSYFREMDDELDNGGLEALLADLLAFDLSAVDLWQIPRTDALLEQKIRSLNSVESWWYGRLMVGSTTRRSGDWRQEIPTETLYSDYLITSEKIGFRRKSEETVFGMGLYKLLPGLIDRKKRTVDMEDERHGHTVRKRTPCYLLPPLREAREAFEHAVGQTVVWPDDTEDDVKSDSESRVEPEF